MSYLTDDLREQLRREEAHDDWDPQAFRQIARAAVAQLDASHAWIDRCAEQFEFYHRQHLLKNPPQLDKAQTNAWYRDKCRVITRRDAK